MPWFLLQKGPCSLVSVSHPSGGSLVRVGWGGLLVGAVSGWGRPVGALEYDAPPRGS